MIIPKIDSTNSFLKQSLSNSTPLQEGTVIMAETQFAGRGQQQQVWHAEPNMNLTISILLNPVFLSVKKQFDLTCAISVAITIVLEKMLGKNVQIKWPNDIYFRDQKLGGVLIENTIQGAQIKNTIIGIGINVNQVSFPEIIPNPVSIKQILQQDYDLKTLLYQLCASIELYYLHLKAGNADMIKAEYLQKLYRIGELHRFEVNNEVILGVILGVNPEGWLKIRSNNALREYDIKQIKFLF
ncbi:MAG: biotin--[acetyl-CoA-carboxylase] ligase [Sphingobacteriaceae bacterium]